MDLRKKLAIKYVRTRLALLAKLSEKKAAAKAFEIFCTPQLRNKKPLPPVFKKAERLRFSFEGCQITGFRWNYPSEKKLLILHGFESTIVNFEAYVAPLVQKGYEVLAFDAPAHGHSSGKKITVIAYKNLVHYINQQYGPVHHFIGHSLGGLTACLFLETISHNSSFKLVLIAPATETGRAINHFFKFLHLGAGVQKQFENTITLKAGHSPQWFSVARAAKNIKAQVLFLQDEEDNLTPMCDVEPIIQAAYPNFKFLITKGLGHRRIYRDSRSVAAVVNFF